jgi:hypothetical protein
MTTRILRFLPLIAACGACLPATAGAQGASPPTGGSPALAPSPFALSGGGQVLLGSAVRFRGTVDRGDAGRTVTIERLEPLTSAWTPQATAIVAPDGSFVASWRPRHSGRFQTRARYQGRTLVVPVVDRGPFTAGVEWDLTAAAAHTLGFTQSGRLGAIPLR